MERQIFKFLNNHFLFFLNIHNELSHSHNYQIQLAIKIHTESNANHGTKIINKKGLEYVCVFITFTWSLHKKNNTYIV